MSHCYSLTASDDALRRLFQFDDPPLPFSARRAIEPGDDVPTVIREDGRRRAVMMRWGLIPSWPHEHGKTRTRRCLVPADAFYLWRKLRDGQWQLYRVSLHDGLFAFAGHWELWIGPDGETRACTILTTESDAILKPLHERMPAIIAPENYNAWLDPGTEEGRIVALAARAYPAGRVRIERTHRHPDPSEPAEAREPSRPSPGRPLQPPDMSTI